MTPAGGRLLSAAAALLLFLASCATPPPPRPVASTDASPYLETLAERQAHLAGGLVATLDLDFRDRKRSRGGKAYVVLSPPGRFRMEVPGFMGSTLLVMTCDGDTVLAYYPEDSLVYRARADSPVLSHLLPVPLPIAPDKVPGLLTGAPGSVASPAPATAVEMSNGDVVLPWTTTSGPDVVYTFHGDSITMTTPVGDGVYTLEMGRSWPHYPTRFTFEEDHLRLKGDFESVRPAEALSPANFSFDPPAGTELVVIEPGS